MIKANLTIFRFYLAIMDALSLYLSEKYTDSSIDNPDYFKTRIVHKIVLMFHTLDKLTQTTQDEVSCRCLLRGILDNVTTYCFIYDRDDKNEVLFRHYLYSIDGYICYKDNVVNGIMEKNSNYPFEQRCNEAINQYKEQLACHPYSVLDNEAIKKLINNANWKYESLQKTDGLRFRDMYLKIGLNKQLAEYYQSYLSQFVHGLSFSNIPCVSPEQIKNVLYESIPLADRMIQAMCRTFPIEEMKQCISSAKTVKKIFKDPDLNVDDLFIFVKALVENDKTLLM